MTLTRFFTTQEKEIDMEAEMQKGDLKRDVAKGDAFKTRHEIWMNSARGWRLRASTLRRMASDSASPLTREHFMHQAIEAETWAAEDEARAEKVKA